MRSSLALLCLLPGIGAAQDAPRCDYHDPVWSRSGDRIAVYSNRGGNFDVYTIRPDGADLFQVTHAPGRDVEPDWTPDGRGLVFVSDRGNGGQSTLYAVDRDGSNVRPVVPDPGVAHAPRWMPDGRAIVYEGRAGDNRDLFRLDIGGTLHRLTTDSANDFRPVSPDGKWLAFQSKRSGTYQLWRMPMAGGGPEALTTGPGNNAYPAWSPDGRRLAFMSDRDGDGDVYVMTVADRSTVRVTTDPALDHAASWSPDGKQLVFVSWRTGAAGIYVVALDGSSLRHLISGCAPRDDRRLMRPDELREGRCSARTVCRSLSRSAL